MMEIAGRRQAEQMLQQALNAGRMEKVHAAHDMADALQGVVDHHGKVIAGGNLASRHDHETYLDPETWAAAAERRDGSWWPAWWQWLGAHSGTAKAPPGMGAPEQGLPPLGDAPGTYVRQA